MAKLLLLCCSLLSLALGVLGSNTSDTQTVCSYLYKKYPGFIVYDPLGPKGGLTLLNNSLYQNTITEYWNVHSSVNRPACAFFPSQAAQVSDAVKQLNKYDGVNFALKGGGHNSNLGFSSTAGGILFSFRPNMQNTTLSADGKTAAVEAGSRWGEAYDALNPYNKVVVGGRLGHIGVAGFILGGGLSYLSSQYGLACDNVAKFETVLADGRLVNASSTENPDLYWALRGGGNQFAIVTTYHLLTHPIGPVWGGLRTYSGDLHSRLLSATTNFTRNYPDKKAAIIPTYDLAGPATLVAASIVFFFYDGATPPAGVFDEFDAIPSLTSDTQTRTYANLAADALGGYIPGLRYQIAVNAFPNLPHDQMLAFLNTHWDTVRSRAAQESIAGDPLDLQILSFAAQPMSVAIQNASVSGPYGANALGLDPLHGDRLWMEYDVSWANPACDGTCPEYVYSVASEMKQLQLQNYSGTPPTNYKQGDVAFIASNPLFMNDAHYRQDPLRSYGQANYERLKAIKAKYDPSGFLSKRQGGFKFS